MITPLQNFVILEPIHEELGSKSGIILSSNADLEPTNKGKVIGLGEAVKLPIKLKDIVLFKPHLFDALDNGKSIILIGREDGIFAKL